MRSSGILMPIFSLPTKGGIGTFGNEAYRFIDFLEKSGQSWWQTLPLNPTNFGDSPYQSFSAYAGNPYFIDPELLIIDELLTRKELESFDFGDGVTVDYEKLYRCRLDMLRLAFLRFTPSEEYTDFCNENSYWLNDFALFMVLKKANNEASWSEWKKSLKFRDKEYLAQVENANRKELEFYKFIQFVFFKQWYKLKNYANKKGIGIIGDLPIYIAYDSADVWTEPNEFRLDSDLLPTSVAGCPPDKFSPQGQLWGNPLYEWERMKQNDFLWWKKRIAHSLKMYDVIRLDHFRGFEAYWSVSAKEDTAVNGQWRNGPGIDLFNSLKSHFGDKLQIIAEDLGFVTPEVKKLLKDTGFFGMKVIQFAFDSDSSNPYLPHNYEKNCVVYTGTHDNNTNIGWEENAGETELRFAKRYLNLSENEDVNYGMIRAALMSVADISIINMQDLLRLGSEARINTPSTIGNNWKWRMNGTSVNDALAEKLLYYTELYFRTRI